MGVTVCYKLWEIVNSEGQGSLSCCSPWFENSLVTEQQLHNSHLHCVL